MAQIPVTQVPVPPLPTPIDLQFQYLVDSTNQLTIGQLTNQSNHWKSVGDGTLILGFTTHPVWCRFTVQQARPAAYPYALELTNFYVDSLTLYQSDSLATWQVQYSGDLIPFALRTPSSRFPTVYVSLSGTTPVTFYARVLSTQHHGYQWRIWDRATFITNRLPDIDRYIMFSLAIMLSLFQLALLVFMRHYVVLRSYAQFALVVCLSVFFASGNSNVLFPHSPYWAHTSHFITVGLLLPSLSYYVVQAYQLPQHRPRLVWVYVGFGSLGILYAVLSLFVRHPYITWVIIAALAIMMGFTLLLLLVLFFSGIRPAIWNVLALVLTLPIYTYFYGRNAGFFPGSMHEETLKFLLMLCFALEPVFVVIMLWQATRERVQAANRLTIEQAHRETIQALDRLRTDFFTNVSHELRTPVTLLLGPVQTLHTRFPDNELYALMYRNATRLQTLINQLLDLAKLDANQMRNLPTAGDLADHMHSWITQFDALAQKRSITLTVRQNQANWLALYDADKVEKIVTNLLSNALKHTPDGGVITVKALYSTTGLTLEVEDTGAGMDAEVLAHLFDRFYQGAKTNRLEAGTGVGLSLTYELVQLLGGTITVNSQLGKGSLFCVSLPVEKSTGYPLGNEFGPSIHQPTINKSLERELIESVGTLPAEAAFSSEEFSNEREPEKPLLLVVEDDYDLRTYIRMTLTPYYAVLEAVDGQQGLEMALDAQPDLIITDLMMPRLDGLDLCRALRADCRTDHIPLIMLTAKVTIENRLAGLETGADEYLTKPFIPAELILRLQNIRRRQAALQTRWQQTVAGLSLSSAIRSPDNQRTPDPLPDELPNFLKQVYAILEQHLDQSDLDVDYLADALSLGSRTLNRKLKVVLGLNTRETIRSYRLQRGSDMLEQGVSPTQVAYAVGFGSLSAFGRAYKEQYGHAPSARQRS
ncbi:ATP-binding protein [Spirosoma agri]|uniref:histidine kinase n=1 Tax=Spirosoma agri TaxID=1987381 RepID=A0A6M0IJD8_9BACT|nr:ATP-binding protein [Spirosoma agri]NEU68378.1 response regulator [Spirosoma agri]